MWKNPIFQIVGRFLKLSDVVPEFKIVGEISTAKNFQKLVNDRRDDHLEKCAL